MAILVKIFGYLLLFICLIGLFDLALFIYTTTKNQVIKLFKFKKNKTPDMVEVNPQVEDIASGTKDIIKQKMDYKRKGKR